MQIVMSDSPKHGQTQPHASARLSSFLAEGPLLAKAGRLEKVDVMRLQAVAETAQLLLHAVRID